jgi:phosphatidate cytidylyltransferase
MLRARVFTALALLGLFLLALFGLPDLAWLFFSSLIAAGLAWEWGGLVRLCGPYRFLFCVLLTALTLGLGYPLLDEVPQTDFAVLPLISVLFWVGVVPFWLRHRWKVAGTLPGITLGFVVLLPSLLAFVQIKLFNPWLLLFVMVCIWLADSAAYFVGRRFGHRKLAPQISPGKSWEGALGALVCVPFFGLLTAVFLADVLEPGRLVFLGLFFVALTILSIEGDLFESLLKREASLKDSGRLLPGHGGLLDRMDSLTSTLPLVWLALLFW